MKMIDTHAHAAIGNPSFPENFPVEDLIGRMDSAGIEKTVLVQSKSRNGMDSPYPAEAARRYSDRLIAVSGGDPTASDGARQLSHRVLEWGVRGVRVFGGRSNLSDARFDAFWQTAIDLGVPVLIAGIARYAELGALCLRFPRLKIVLDHLGRPDFSNGLPSGLVELARCPSICVKFSTHVIAEAKKHGAEPQAILDATVAAFGAKRMIWGSNYPANHEPDWPYLTTIETAKAMTSGYATEEQEFILFRTAVSIWPELAD